MMCMEIISFRPSPAPRICGHVTHTSRPPKAIRSTWLQGASPLCLQHLSRVERTFEPKKRWKSLVEREKFPSHVQSCKTKYFRFQHSQMSCRRKDLGTRLEIPMLPRATLCLWTLFILSREKVHVMDEILILWIKIFRSWVSQRKKTTFRDATNGFPAK